MKTNISKTLSAFLIALGAYFLVNFFVIPANPGDETMALKVMSLIMGITLLSIVYNMLKNNKSLL